MRGSLFTLGACHGAPSDSGSPRSRLAERRYDEAVTGPPRAGLVELPFLLEHETPMAMDGGLLHVICGHTHPGVVLAEGVNGTTAVLSIGPQVTLLPRSASAQASTS